MRSPYSILVVFAVTGFVGSSAQAVELSLVPNQGLEGENLDIQLSQTAAISIQMDMDADDMNVSFIYAFLDATPLGEPETEGYDVVGNVFNMQRDNGDPWFRNVGSSESPNIEEYFLNAADDDQRRPQHLWGTNGPGRFIVDSIIIHGTEVGEYDLYFENQWTVEPGHAARTPGVFDRNNNQHGYSPTWCHFGGFPGFLCFTNAWRDDHVEFDVPFTVIVVPEPASFVLLTLAALPLLRRRLGE